MWRLPNEIPDCYVGDRIILLTLKRPKAGMPLEYRLVILERTEDSWHSPDPVYGGYDVGDGVAWMYEKDIMPKRHQFVSDERSLTPPNYVHPGE